MADRLGGPSVSGLQQLQVTKDLTAADGEAVGGQGFGQLPAGPGPFLAQQFGQAAGDTFAAGVIRFGTGQFRGERGRSASEEALEGCPGGVRVTAEMPGNPGGRPAQVEQQNHFQPASGHGREMGSTQGLQFDSLGVSQVKV